MSKERFKVVPAVYLFMLQGENLLLMRRANTGFEDGYYMVPSGHVERNERPQMAVIREAKEEVGVEVAERDLQFVHTMYRRRHDDSGERIDLFFLTQKWMHEPQNCEPHKCDYIGWYSIRRLPKNTSPRLQIAIKNYQNGIVYSEVDWDH